MMPWPPVKVWGYLAGVIAAGVLLAGVWYAGGAGCREAMARASLAHELDMVTTRDRLAAENAALHEKLAAENASLRGKINELVADIQVCSYTGNALDYLNSVRTGR